MANPGTLYRFRIELSDVGRSLYEKLDLRVQMHPSESAEYLVTRILAYALNYESGLTFAPGLCTGDEPAIQLLGSQGEIALWIDVGSPSPERIHKASKASKRVRIYTYKDPQVLIEQVAREKVHRVSEVELFSLDGKFLDELIQTLGRQNQWNLVYNDGELMVTIADECRMGTMSSHRFR